MRTLIFSLIVLASLGLGQTKLEGEAAEQAWQKVEFLSTKGGRTATTTPPTIRGAIIVPTPTVNEYGENVSVIVSASGTYVVQGVRCNGNSEPLGAHSVDFRSSGEYVVIQVVDTGLLRRAAPGMSQFCSVNLFKVDGELSQLTIGLSGYEQRDLPVRVEQDGFTPVGEYYLEVSGKIGTNVSIAVGQYTMGRILPGVGQGKYLFVFPKEAYLPQGNITTLTVCEDGGCSTGLFRRRAQSTVTSGGKG